MPAEKESGYAYTNTRVRVKKSRLLAEQDYQKLMKMSLPEIARFLGESEYKKEISEMGATHSGADLLEYSLNRNMANTFKKILSYSIKDAEKQVQFYLEKWDLWNIKTILRGKFSETPDEGIFNELIPAGKFDEGFLKKVISESGTVEDAVEWFKKTEYYGLLKEHSGNLVKLEDKLDRKYFEKSLKGASPELRKFIEMDIAVNNALDSLRAKKAELPYSPIPGGVNEKKLKFDSSKGLEELRVELREKLVLFGRKMLHNFKRNAEPIIGYFIAKENEIRNLRILVRGKHSGLDAELIQKQLVA